MKSFELGISQGKQSRNANTTDFNIENALNYLACKVVDKALKRGLMRERKLRQKSPVKEC